MQSRVFITGATGYIGKAFLKTLVNQGWKINVLARDPAKLPYFLRNSDLVKIFKGTLEDVDVLIEATKDAEVIFHLAASLALFEKNNRLYTTNVIGTMNLLRACQENDSNAWIIFASSIEAVGPSSKPFTTLQDKPAPACDYGLTKLIGERILQQFCKHNSSFDYTIVRIGNVYGYGQGNVVGLKAILEENSWRTQVLQHILKDYTLHLVHIEDLVRMLSELLSKDKCRNQTYFFVNEHVSVGQIIEVLKKRVGVKAISSRLPLDSLALSLWRILLKAVAIDDLLIYISLGWPKKKFRNYDGSTALADLNYTPLISLEEGCMY